jgi:hypothetical protein
MGIVALRCAAQDTDWNQLPGHIQEAVMALRKSMEIHRIALQEYNLWFFGLND